MKIAVILTVYNRKMTTIKGLESLINAINKDLENEYKIYMTNDGCTDGTDIAVKELFPDITIINTKGNLYWSQGMNIAWEKASNENNYDFYIWFNDDAILYENALKVLFKPLLSTKNVNSNDIDTIVSGAFMDNLGNVSYGGRTSNNKYIVPNNNFQDIYYMNGNLVLIPKAVFNKLGYIDTHYIHSLGDWDYGLCAKKNGIKVLLTSEYVGITDRHDEDTKPYFNTNHSLINRIKYLYSPKYSLKNVFYFHKKHFGLFVALRRFIKDHIFTIFPLFHKKNENL